MLSKYKGTDLLSVYSSVNCYLALKKLLSGFTKDTQWEISTEKAWKQLFLWLTLLNMRL